jgi:hypothetical protein
LSFATFLSKKAQFFESVNSISPTPYLYNSFNFPCAAGFLGFSFWQGEIPKGLMVGLQDLWWGACSPA